MDIRLSEDGQEVIITIGGQIIKINKELLKPLVCGIVKGCCGNTNWKPYRG